MIRKPIKALLAVAALLGGLLAGAAMAQEVTLHAPDGSLSMSGRLVEFDAGIYTLQTPIGLMMLGVDQVVCEGAACPDLLADISDFSFAGSSGISTTLMPALIEAYAASLGGHVEVDSVTASRVVYHVLDTGGAPYMTLSFDMGNAQQGFAALAAGDADVALSSRRITDSEKTRFMRQGMGDLTSAAQEYLLALDGVSIVVNPNNPIQVLRMDQISEIFSGNVRNWREVGGPDAQINIYRRDAQAGITQEFNALVMVPSRRSLAQTALIQPDNASVAAAVEADKNGIGITSMVEQNSTAALLLETTCGQVAALSSFAIKTEEYPMSRRMYAYVKSAPLPEKLANFLAFITSDAAQNVVEQAGYVSQTISRSTLNDQGRKIAHALLAERDRAAFIQLQSMVAELQGATRSSLTFRFIDDTMALDNRAVADIARLAARLKSGAFAGKQLLIMGFADGTDTLNASQRISQARADFIRDAVIEASNGADLGNVQLLSVGYGKLAPVGCNSSEEGRAANRRVEIWVR